MEVDNKLDLREIIREGVDLIDVAEKWEMWCTRKPGKPYILRFLYFISSRRFCLSVKV